METQRATFKNVGMSSEKREVFIDVTSLFIKNKDCINKIKNQGHYVFPLYNI